MINIEKIINEIRHDLGNLTESAGRLDSQMTTNCQVLIIGTVMIGIIFIAQGVSIYYLRKSKKEEKKDESQYVSIGYGYPVPQP